MTDFSRRDFLKLSAASVGALTFSSTGGLKNTEVHSAPNYWWREETTTKYSYCDMCYWHCGIKVEVGDGKVAKIYGDEEDPLSRGNLCPRGQAGVQQVYNPDRLKQPLIREGPRGEGKYRKASWKEALDYAAEKLNQVSEDWDGPEAIGWLNHCTSGKWFSHLAAAWGSPNSGSPSHALCLGAREIASKLTFGLPVGEHMPVDWENTEFITLIGNHIGENTHNTLMNEFVGALEGGANLAVVDPRYSTAASKSDYWLPIKPGTDTALLLAWISLLIRENRYDISYVEKYAKGFEQLKKRVKEYTPEWAAEKTDLDRNKIEEVGREMARYRPHAVVPPNRKASWYGNDTQRLRALFILNALLGNYGREGGFYFSASPWISDYSYPSMKLESSGGGCGGGGGGLGRDSLPNGVRRRADKKGDKFLYGILAEPELIDAIVTEDPYPVKGLVVAGNNIFHSVPKKERTKKAIKELDFYMAIDILPQEHVMWADVVLPESTYLERYDDLYSVHHKTTPYLSFREPAIEPLYNTKPGWEIAKELGERLGLGEYFPFEDFEGYLNDRLSDLGLSVEDMKEKGIMKQPQLSQPFIKDYESKGQKPPFGTPSSKIELYSERLAENDFEPVPTYEAPKDPPDGYFRLLYGRSPVHSFSRTQNNPWLSEIDPENKVWINAESAKEMELEDGDRVVLENQDGIRSKSILVKKTERIRKDCVYIVHGFGHDTPRMENQHEKGASDIELQSDYELDPISGSAGMSVNFVKIAERGGKV